MGRHIKMALATSHGQPCYKDPQARLLGGLQHTNLNKITRSMIPCEKNRKLL
jgi:hypothetical protein